MRRSRPIRSRKSRNAPQQHNITASLITSGIDINTNLGEGYGQYRVEGELDLLPYATSANIACGAHAGDPTLMEAALEEARNCGLAVGAHIAYPDLAGFGRREMHLTNDELRATILYQLGALSGIAKTLGFEITQVRPHGFMYRQMIHDTRVAITIAKTIAEFDRWLVLIGPAGNNLLTAGEKSGLRVAGEVWIDRAYDSHGNLLPDTNPRSEYKTRQEILKQAQQLIADRSVTTVDGSTVQIDFHTIHLHAQMVDAAEVAQQVCSWLPDACPLTSEPFAVDNVEPLAFAYNSD
jgi:UPF0271 protein